MAYTEEEVLETLPIVRPVLEQIANKWTILILTFLCSEPQRFNALKRRLNGITQKALTEALRKLERNGLVERKVLPTSPVSVEYSMTSLGRTLQPPFLAVYEWALEHKNDLRKAQTKFDKTVSESPKKG